MFQGKVLGQLAKMKTVETAKQLASNKLSMEQQLYYKVRIVFASYGLLASIIRMDIYWGIS